MLMCEMVIYIVVGLEFYKGFDAYCKHIFKLKPTKLIKYLNSFKNFITNRIISNECGANLEFQFRIIF